MKTNRLFVSFIMAAMAMTSVAQTMTNRFEFGYAGNSSFSIPKEFSYNDVPYMVMYGGNDANTVQLYDENLEMVKQITMKESIPFNYQQTYQDETREVTAVNEVGRSAFCEYASYEEFIQKESGLDPSFNESCLIITNLSDGTRKISVDYSKLQNPFQGNSRMYFAYDYFGLKYPRVYFIDSSDSFVGYRVEYYVEYSDWEAAGTRTVDCSKEQERIKLCNINLNNGEGRTNRYFEVSQTLFNKDASFEYIMPIYKFATKGNVSYNPDVVGPDDPDKIVTTRSTPISEQKKLALAGFQILSEDGNVVSNIVFDGGFEGEIYLDEAFVITIGSSIYLAFDGYCNGENSTIFYKIDNYTNSIQKVKTVPSNMSVSPAIVNRGAVINVNFSDGNLHGADIIMNSVSGAASKKLHIPAGQASAQIHTDAPKGMYCISRLTKGKVQETTKVIVK